MDTIILIVATAAALLILLAGFLAALRVLVRAIRPEKPPESARVYDPFVGYFENRHGVLKRMWDMDADDFPDGFAVNAVEPLRVADGAIEPLRIADGALKPPAS
jgi:hypothetical protein